LKEKLDVVRKKKIFL